MRLLFLLFLASPLGACTDFLLQAIDESCVVGRSMEFGLDLHSEVLVQPQGKEMQSQVLGKGGMKWPINYAYIGMTALGEDWVVDGMNEAGLSFGALWFPGASYPKIDVQKVYQTVALEDVGDWILSSFASVDEVKRGVERIQIWAHEIEKLGQIPPLHFSLHDRSGKSAAIEFIDGKLFFLENPVGVLTNAPTLSWHLTNLSNYLNLSAMQKGAVRFAGLVLNPQGEGFGMLGLPGDWTPPSRFVRIATFKRFADQAPRERENVTLAFHLLNTVDIPHGLVRSAQKEHYDYTQWVVVKDLHSGTLYYRTYGDLDVYKVRLAEEVHANQNMRKLPVYGTRP